VEKTDAIEPRVAGGTLTPLILNFVFFLLACYLLLASTMVNTVHTQFTGISLPRRDQHPDAVTHAQRGRQDNPAQSPAPSRTPQPAPPKNGIRTAPKKGDTNSTHPKTNRLGKDVQLNLWVRPVVKAELERVATREGLSVSATGEAFLEKALQQDLYTQQSALLETILDRAIGRHMRMYSDRNASLQARNIQKTELIFQIVTQILSKMPGMDGKKLEAFMEQADELARASITRITATDKKAIDTEKAAFEKGGNASG